MNCHVHRKATNECTRHKYEKGYGGECCFGLHFLWVLWLQHYFFLSILALIIQSPAGKGRGIFPGNPVTEGPCPLASWLTYTPFVAVGLKPTQIKNVRGKE